MKMKIITEEDAPKLGGLVEVTHKKLLPLNRAKAVARSKADGGEPLLCEYLVVSKRGRSMKRYLVLTRKENENAN